MHISRQPDGNAAAVAVLYASKPRFEFSDNGNWNNQGVSFYLELPTDVYAQLYRRREQIEESLVEMYKPLVDAYDGYYGSSVRLVPTETPPSNWREMARAWLVGEGTNNQGRVRSDNIAARSYDGLLFRSQPEINLYRALKAAGVSFAPLPVFVRGGKDYRRIEPDFVLLYHGITAVARSRRSQYHSSACTAVQDIKRALVA